MRHDIHSFFFLALPLQEAKLIIDNNRVTVREVRIPALSERKGKPLTIGARRDDVIQTALFVCILLEQTEEVQVFWKHRRIKH